MSTCTPFTEARVKLARLQPEAREKETKRRGAADAASAAEAALSKATVRRCRLTLG